MLPKLCLGTAQFGLDYGVTNTKGKINQEEITEIIKNAYLEGIDYIDTAQGYGDAEILLGNTNYLKDNFKIINKFSHTGISNCEENLIEYWDDCLLKSLKNLKISKLDTFLIHNSNDLFKPYSNLLIDWLSSLKRRSIVNRIGVSLYNEEMISKLPLDKLDIIQIPLSIYDQRFLKSGSINFLRSKGISIHARSIFLQGLILQVPSKWPSFFSDDFKSHHKNIYTKFLEHKITMMEAALSFLHRLSDIELILIGVTSLKEFKEILKIWRSCKEINRKLSRIEIDCSWIKSDEIDPRVWITKN